MNTQDRLINWHFAWQITKDVIVCRSCHAAQLESNKDAPFQHYPDCKNSAEASDPWYELDRICQGFQESQHG